MTIGPSSAHFSFNLIYCEDAYCVQSPELKTGKERPKSNRIYQFGRQWPQCLAIKCKVVKMQITSWPLTLKRPLFLRSYNVEMSQTSSLRPRISGFLKIFSKMEAASRSCAICDFCAFPHKLFSHDGWSEWRSMVICFTFTRLKLTIPWLTIWFEMFSNDDPNRAIHWNGRQRRPLLPSIDNNSRWQKWWDLINPTGNDQLQDSALRRHIKDVIDVLYCSHLWRPLGVPSTH